MEPIILSCTFYLYLRLNTLKPVFTQGHQDPVLGAEYIPGQNSRFITYGKGHIIFWDQEGNKLLKKSGLFEVRFRFLLRSFVLIIGGLSCFGESL